MTAPKGSAKRHPFVTWLVEHHGRDETPVGDLARDLRHSPDFPTWGGRADLRGYLYDVGVETWALEAFDQAWTAWKVPTCLSPGCGAKAAGGSSSFCPTHGGRFHHAGTELL